MPRKLYIADWHYRHNNILVYDDRPFTNVDDMDEALVKRWNSAVRDDDTVYVLGDMFWCSVPEAIEVLKKLTGNKVLIIGNHDRTGDSKFREQFCGVHEYLEIPDGLKNVVLCHYPIPCFKNHFRGWFHLYGHVHNSFEANMMEHDKRLMKELYTVPCNMYNVGAMMPWMDYTPRTLDEIIERCV